MPFFLLTVFCFANSSQKLHDWFIGTQMYKKHLESFVQKKGMTARTKATILTSVTALMAVGFVLMLRKGIIVPCVVLAVVWVCHLVYFLFGKLNFAKSSCACYNGFVIRMQRRIFL